MLSTTWAKSWRLPPDETLPAAVVVEPFAGTSVPLMAVVPFVEALPSPAAVVALVPTRGRVEVEFRKPSASLIPVEFRFIPERSVEFLALLASSVSLARSEEVVEVEVYREEELLRVVLRWVVEDRVVLFFLLDEDDDFGGVHSGVQLDEDGVHSGVGSGVHSGEGDGFHSGVGSGVHFGVAGGGGGGGGGVHSGVGSGLGAGGAVGRSKERVREHEGDGGGAR